MPVELLSTVQIIQYKIPPVKMPVGIPERKHSVWLCGYSGRVLKESSDMASDRLKRMTMSIETACLERGGQTGLQIDLTTHKCSGIVAHKRGT